MAKVYPFPTCEDRAQIKDAIIACARGEVSQNTMNSVIAVIMRKHKDNLSMVVDEFRVTDVGNFITHKGVFPVVTIQALKLSPDGRCPACKCDEFGYIRGDKSIVALCRGCGCIYERRADDEEIG